MSNSQKPFSDVGTEGVRQAGKTLQDIVAQLSGQPIFLFGIAAMLLAIVGIFATAFAQNIPQLALFPYTLLVFGLVLVIISYRLASKPVTNPQQIQRGSLSQPPPPAQVSDDAVLEPAVARPVNLSFEAYSANNYPAGWFNSWGFVDFVSTAYEAYVVDRPDGGNGACVLFQNPRAAETEFGSLMQRIPAHNLAGKVIHLEAEIKTWRVEQWAGLWLRADGDKIPTLVFDNMSRRPIRGSTSWARYSIDVQLPKETAWLNYGIVLSGRGTMWADNFRLLVWMNGQWVDV
jgi:hypothetical protein